MSDRDNLESESDQPPANKAKSHYDTPSSHQTQQSSQGSQNIIIETGYHHDQLNTRHTINVIVNYNKKERQKRYREQNRDKLKQREAERRKRIQYSQNIAGPSTSSKTNRIELNNEEIITAQSSSGSEEIQASSIQRNDQGNELNALQKKRERQQRYRKQNRDKLKQREAERRKRIQYSQSIAGPCTSSETNRIELNNEEIITAQSSSGSENIQASSIQRNDQGNELNALQKKRERQQRYRKQNRDRLKQREAERRKRIQYSQSIAGPCTSSKTNRIELNNEEIITAQSSSGSEEIQASSIKRNDQGLNAEEEAAPSGQNDNQVPVFAVQEHTYSKRPGSSLSQDQSAVKCCYVPTCPTNSAEFPQKLFVKVPPGRKIRLKWLAAVGRLPTPDFRSPLYCCQDHFNLETDVENWERSRHLSEDLIPKRDVLPYKFDTLQSSSNIPGMLEIKIEEVEAQDPDDHHMTELSQGTHGNAKATAVTDSDTMSTSPQPEICIKTENVFDSMEDMSMYEDDAPSTSAADVVKPKQEVTYHTSRCTVCAGEIVGFRYTCVQCSDFDLCSACELSRAHPQHYVLRISQLRPYEEVEAVLAVIRLQLLKDLDPIKEPDGETIRVKIEKIDDNNETPSEMSVDNALGDTNTTAVTAPPQEAAASEACSGDGTKSTKHKSCGVPLCMNTSVTTPKKLFITVPNKRSVRDRWLHIARRDPLETNISSPIYFCQDHFDLPKDMENYMQYHVMGSVTHAKMKPNCVPTKFECQPDRRKRTATDELPYIYNKQRKMDAQNSTTIEPGKAQTAEKSTQANVTHKFRSKAVQAQPKTVDRQTSP